MQSVVEDPMSHRGLAEISIWVVVVIVIILQTIAIMQLKQKPNEEITTNDWIGLDRTTPSRCSGVAGYHSGAAGFISKKYLKNNASQFSNGVLSMMKNSSWMVKV